MGWSLYTGPGRNETLAGVPKWATTRLKSFALVILVRESLGRGRLETLGEAMIRQEVPLRAARIRDQLSCRKPLGSDSGHLEVAKGDHQGRISAEVPLLISSWQEAAEISALAYLHPFNCVR